MQHSDHPVLFPLLLLCFLVLAGCSETSQIRGVHPRDVSKYSTFDSSGFSCGDGSSISWERVNDDHCDCVSGWDEPGTSGIRWHNQFFC
jgi:protein kinase C substrate 80K-H